MQENPKTSRVFLFGSVVLGVLAMILAFAYLSREGGAANRVPPVTILVAAHDLKQGQILDTHADVVSIQIPAEFKGWKDAALTADLLPVFNGHRVNRSILKGTPILVNDLSAAGDLEIGAGMWALSIPVRGANALSGLLVPGDSVTMLVTKPGAISAATKAGEVPLHCVTVLPRAVRVLAVGSRLGGDRQQITAVSTYDAFSRADPQQTVTIEVTEEETKTILEQAGATNGTTFTFPVFLALVKKAKPAAEATTSKAGSVE